MNRMIGLDRVVIGNFRIINIDFNKLLFNSNVMLEKEGDFVYLLENGEGFRNLKICDHEMFGELWAGTKKTFAMKQDFSRMDISVSNFYTCNLKNVSVEEFKQNLIEIFEYLYRRYGISVCLDNLKIRQLEINTTFKLKSTFYQYHRALKLLMFNLPKTYQKSRSICKIDKEKQRMESETFYRGNSMMEIKIYDKKKQLEESKNLKLNDEYMRIEIVLKKTQKVKEVFKSEFLEDLTNEQIVEFYYGQFKKLFEKPYRKWQRENREKLRQMILKHKGTKHPSWMNNLIRECCNIEQRDQVPFLLDVRDLFEEIKKQDKYGRYKRVIQSFNKNKVSGDVYYQNDAEKIEEIIKNVDDEYHISQNRYMPISGELIECDYNKCDMINLRKNENNYEKICL